MRMQAVFNDTVIADSDQTEVVEGNHYFPEEAIREEFFDKTRMKTVCPWKGIASYFTVTVGDQSAKNAAWQYRHPLPLARKIRRYVAFYPQVQVTEAPATAEHEAD